MFCIFVAEMEQGRATSKSKETYHITLYGCFLVGKSTKILEQEFWIPCFLLLLQYVILKKWIIAEWTKGHVRRKPWSKVREWVTQWCGGKCTQNRSSESSGLKKRLAWPSVWSSMPAEVVNDGFIMGIATLTHVTRGGYW